MFAYHDSRFCSVFLLVKVDCDAYFALKLNLNPRSSSFLPIYSPVLTWYVFQL